MMPSGKTAGQPPENTGPVSCSRRAMLRFTCYVLLVLLLTALIIAGIFLGIVAWPRDVFSHSYQSEIQQRYQTLLDAESPKIILLGGSSVTYGIDEALLEKETGYQVVNLGLYASFGDLIPTELSKANIRPGDIVVAAYEYGWNREDNFDTVGPDMVLSGFDSHLALYRHIPLRIWPQLLGYLREFRDKKAQYEADPGEDIRREVFDAQGRLALVRPNGVFHYDPDGENANPQDVRDSSVADDSARYLRRYRRYVERRGAKLVFTAPPLLDRALVGTAEDLHTLAENEERATGIPYISDPAEYLFGEEYFYDTVYHCTDEGAERRTRLLIRDLRRSGVLAADRQGAGVPQPFRAFMVK